MQKHLSIIIVTLKKIKVVKKDLKCFQQMGLCVLRRGGDFLAGEK